VRSQSGHHFDPALVELFLEFAPDLLTQSRDSELEPAIAS
jgi:response regulator RpfG family c-di-GMP phosphodiesterase